MNKILEDFLIIVFGIIMPIFILIKLLKEETKDSKPSPTVRPTVKPTVRPTSTPGSTTRPTSTPGSTPTSTPGSTTRPTSTPESTTRPTSTPGSTPTNTPGNAMLYAITNKIKSDVNNLKSHPPCQDDNSNYLISDINQLKGKATELINNTNDPPSPSSVDYFNNIMNDANQTIQKIQSLPNCFCPQGTYGADGSCVCPPEYPYPLLGSDGKTVYCSNVLCKNINHGKFVPDSGSDPSKNQCVCDDGYAHDENKYPSDPQCYSLPFSNTLKTWADNIKDDVSQLKSYLG